MVSKKLWNGIPKTLVNSFMSVSSLLLKLKDFLSFKLKIEFFILVILMFISALAEVASIGLVVPFLTALTSPGKLLASPSLSFFFNLFSISNNTQLVTFLTLVFCSTIFLSAGIRIVTLWFQTRFCYSIAAELSASIYKNTLYQEYSFHLNKNSSELVSTIVSKTSATSSYAILPLLNLFSSSLVLLAVLGVLIILNPYIALGALLLFAIFYSLIILGTKKKLSIDSDNISIEQDNVIRKLQEGFGNIQDILLGNFQDVYLASYRSSFSLLQRAWANVEIIRTAPRFLVEALLIISMVLLAYFLSSNDGGLINALPILGAMALGAQRLLPAAQIIYSSIASMRGGFSSLEDVFLLLEGTSQEKLINLDEINIDFNREINLKNINFKFNESGPFILNDLDLNIRKGDKLGIIGPTGSGKSTLINILMGLIDHSSGMYKVDNHIINKKSKFSWRTKISHVPQSIYLTDASISENIALGQRKEHIDYELLINSAKKAQIHDTIMSWEDKYETIVGEGGMRISGGQKQRLGIARAIYKQAKVIIFDEATSALDSSTEDSVMQSIFNLDDDLTLIIVAHRLSTLKHCTNIIELSNGKVVKEGTYEEIIN